MSVIKISELNAIPSAPTADDFLPLVDSASMTTYRATLAELAQALTQSQYAIGAGYSSASYYSTQSLYATQSLWATQSLTASSLNFVPNFATNATNSLSASAATNNLFHWTAPSASANASSSIMGYGDDGSGRDLTLSTNNVVRHRWAWDGRTYLNNSTGSHWIAGDETESDFYGHKVSISPSGSVTASFFDAKGNPDDVNIGKYFCNGLAGQSGTFTQFDSGSGLWKLCKYEGGILVASSSTAVSPVSSNTVDTVPIGTIIAFGGTSIPNNWLECDGAALLTASYWRLFQAILTTETSSVYGYTCDVYGNRNAAGLYFKMPDLRGEFLRGWDHGRGIDTLRSTSSYQAPTVGSHYHGVGGFTQAGNDDCFFIYRSWNDGTGTTYTGRIITGDSGGAYGTVGQNPGFPAATSNPVNTTAGDPHPRNVAVTYIIKYSNAVDFAASGSTIAGDVTGNTSATTVVALRGTSIDVTAPTDGQYLKYDAGTNKWTPASITGVSGVGRSYIIANPGTGWVSQGGTDLYVINYNRHTNYRNLAKINMLTNAVTFQCTSSNISWNWYGRSFVLPSGIPQISGSNERAYLFTGDGLYDYPLATNNLRLISGTGGHYNDLPISVSFAASSGSRPTVWCLNGSYGAGANGYYPTVRWRKHHWTSGGGWTYTWASTDLDLRTIQNGTEFLKFYNDYPSYSGGTSDLMLWDYNYILNRYYIMDSDNGWLHILNQTTGTPWTNWNGTSITYLKTLAVPSVDSTDWGDSSAEKLVVDYDQVTGAERGIIYTRRSNTSLLGVVNYVNWPE